MRCEANTAVAGPAGGAGPLAIAAARSRANLKMEPVGGKILSRDRPDAEKLGNSRLAVARDRET
jgi:hypothetical protein